MNEQQTVVFSLPANLYAPGAPVVLESGRLLKNLQTSQIFLELTMRNVQPKTIRAVKVHLTPYDAFHHPLGNAFSYQYLDFRADRDVLIGRQVMIPMANPFIREVEVKLEQIAFADATLWQADGEAWKPLGQPEPLETLEDEELIRQFKLEYGESCRNLPLTDRDRLWCVCGALNSSEEECCHSCGKKLSDVAQIDLEALRQAKNERLAAEQEAAEQEQAEKEKAQQEAAAQKAKVRKKKRRRLLAFVLVLILAVVGATYIPGMVEQHKAYQAAVQLLEEGKYDQAIAAFLVLGDYRDSEQQLENAREGKYRKALNLLEQKNYRLAYVEFRGLGEYKDAPEYLSRFQVEAELITQTGDYNGKKEYTINHIYQNGVPVKTEFSYTSDCRSYFYGYDFTDYQPSGVCIAQIRYDEKGREIQLDLLFKNQNFYTRKKTYDAEGRLVRMTEDRKAGGNAADSCCVYSYNEDGLVTQMLWYQNLWASGKPYATVTYEYDSHGFIRRETTVYRDKNAQKNNSDIYYQNTYNEDGKPLVRSTGNGKRSYAYEYDGDGNKIRETYSADYKVEYDAHLTYDEFGNKLEEKKTYSDGSVRITKYVYNYVYAFE